MLGSAAHINLDSHLTKEQYAKLLQYAAEVGCSYITWNIPNSECDDCGFITKVPISKCPKCGSILVENITKTLNRLKCSNKECDYTRNLNVESE